MIGLYRFYTFIYSFLVLYRILFFIHQQGWKKPLLLIAFLICILTLAIVIAYSFRFFLTENLPIRLLPYFSLLSEIYFLQEAFKVYYSFGWIDLALSGTAVYTVFLYSFKLKKPLSEPQQKESKQ